jgi:K(+)-stimulated pyrophosphate-energized sodium pump
VPADTAEKIKPIIEFVKANAGTKAALSGFHDPTGDKAQNEELAKNRAKMVREMVRSAGLMEDQILMAKPEQTAGSGDNQEARRVEVTVRK